MTINYTDETVMDGGDGDTPGKLWRPLRELTSVDTTVDTITNLQRQVGDLTATVDQVPDTSSQSSTTPLQVHGVSATESPFKTSSGQMVSLVAVSFTPDSHDTAFAGAQIWFTGFNGSATPQLVAEGGQSPVQFLCDTTNETVTVTVVAYHVDGSTTAFATAPTTTVLLDGVVSAPAAPSISQTLTPVALGYQFAFNQLGALSADLIDSYRVYRNSTNSFGSATLLRTFVHDATNTGAIVVQDNVGGGQTDYYWVTAVNRSGLESSPQAAQSGAVTSGTAGSRSVIANNTASTFTGANPCSQSGTSTTILIASSQIQWGFGIITYNSGSVNPGSYGHFYVYSDDPNYLGGSVTFTTTATKSDLYAADGRIYFGEITTVAGGGGTGSGGGGGCPLSGAPVKLYGKPEWWMKRVQPCENFITIETVTGRRGTFSRDDRRYSNRGLLPLTEWNIGDLALTEDGEERVTAVIAQYLPGATVDSYEGTEGHVYSAWGFIGHNMKNI